MEDVLAIKQAEQDVYCSRGGYHVDALSFMLTTIQQLKSDSVVKCYIVVDICYFLIFVSWRRGGERAI